MSCNIKISDLADKDLDYFRAYKKELYEECFLLTKELATDPTKGTGKPTRLKRIGDNVWSRRLGIEDRMVYEVYGNTVIIAAFRNHID